MMAQGENSVEEYELTKPPNWSGIERTTASTKLAGLKEDCVKIILNKVVTDWSDFLEPVEERFPAIISRHARTIKSYLFPA
jgi:hypothetical protein